jgi:hypothetical protein
MTADDKILGSIISLAALIIVTMGAWATHVIVCIKASAWLFLIAGALFVPVGVIHGLGVWVGAW